MSDCLIYIIHLLVCGTESSCATCGFCARVVGILTFHDSHVLLLPHDELKAAKRQLEWGGVRVHLDARHHQIAPVARIDNTNRIGHHPARLGQGAAWHNLEVCSPGNPGLNSTVKHDDFVFFDHFGNIDDGQVISHIGTMCFGGNDCIRVHLDHLDNWGLVLIVIRAIENSRVRVITTFVIVIQDGHHINEIGIAHVNVCFRLVKHDPKSCDCVTK